MELERGKALIEFSHAFLVSKERVWNTPQDNFSVPAARRQRQISALIGQPRHTGHFYEVGLVVLDEIINMFSWEW